ncbi:LexA/Signal peptidase [Bimuria novae-zelandiae CBS 107.79]|uniref:Mitochondrial inner membrane protease subunit 2 n=1 Tax=Bimuria novae-zelandiae CBS 107.79 TaxID=1447943 RepID=A0A6A5VJ48_9PLEO|nr:LexA/Signal peptidase [Bimuria novae-zelandiae CBS 107.79]
MSPTLSPLAHTTPYNDKILIQRGAYARSDICRGDIITFWKPHRRGEISIKRVIGVEGDTVYPHRGYACDEEKGKVVVPRGHVWVEGDNWRRSYDSCDFGPVSLGLVDGKARWVWRDWLRLQKVGDEREDRGVRSRVVPGQKRGEDVLDAIVEG